MPVSLGSMLVFVAIAAAVAVRSTEAERGAALAQQGQQRPLLLGESSEPARGGGQSGRWAKQFRRPEIHLNVQLHAQSAQDVPKAKKIVLGAVPSSSPSSIVSPEVFRNVGRDLFLPGMLHFLRTIRGKLEKKHGPYINHDMSEHAPEMSRELQDSCEEAGAQVYPASLCRLLASVYSQQKSRFANILADSPTNLQQDGGNHVPVVELARILVDGFPSLGVESIAAHVDRWLLLVQARITQSENSGGDAATGKGISVALVKEGGPTVGLAVQAAPSDKPMPPSLQFQPVSLVEKGGVDDYLDQAADNWRPRRKRRKRRKASSNDDEEAESDEDSDGGGDDGSSSESNDDVDSGAYASNGDLDSSPLASKRRKKTRRRRRLEFRVGNKKDVVANAARDALQPSVAASSPVGSMITGEATAGYLQTLCPLLPEAAADPSLCFKIVKAYSGEYSSQGVFAHVGDAVPPQLKAFASTCVSIILLSKMDAGVPMPVAPDDNTAVPFTPSNSSSQSFQAPQPPEPASPPAAAATAQQAMQANELALDTAGLNKAVASARQANPCKRAALDKYPQLFPVGLDSTSSWDVHRQRNQMEKEMAHTTGSSLHLSAPKEASAVQIPLSFHIMYSLVSNQYLLVQIFMSQVKQDLAFALNVPPHRFALSSVEPSFDNMYVNTMLEIYPPLDNGCSNPTAYELVGSIRTQILSQFSRIRWGLATRYLFIPPNGAFRTIYDKYLEPDLDSDPSRPYSAMSPKDADEAGPAGQVPWRGGIFYRTGPRYAPTFGKNDRLGGQASMEAVMAGVRQFGGYTMKAGGYRGSATTCSPVLLVSSLAALMAMIV